jgi:hypothetical protein
MSQDYIRIKYNRRLRYRSHFLELSDLAHSNHITNAMRLLHVATAVQLLAARLVTAVPLDTPSTPVVDIDPAVDPLEALTQLQQSAYETLEQNESVSKRAPKGCSLATTTIRRDW